MSFDFNEAREIVEAAKKRGLIREHGAPDAPPKPEPKNQPSGETLPDWLQDGMSKKSDGGSDSPAIGWRD